MGKTDVIAKLREKNEEFLKTLEKAEQVLKNPNVRGVSEIALCTYHKYKSICDFYKIVIKKVENDYELKEALIQTFVEETFEESFVKPRNIIEHGLFLFELEGFRLAFLTIQKNFLQ